MKGKDLPPKAFMSARSTCSWFMGSRGTKLCNLSAAGPGSPGGRPETPSPPLWRCWGCAPGPAAASALCCRNRCGILVDGLDGVCGRRPCFLWLLRPPLGLPGFHLVQPGLEALAGEVRVVEVTISVRSTCGARQVLPLRSCKVVRGEAQPQVLVHVRALVWPPRSRTAAGARHVGLGHLRLHPAADKFVKLVLQTTLPVLPAITRQPPH